MHFAGAVGSQHDNRDGLGFHGAEFGHGDLEIGEQFQQERLERLIGAVELVDQQHGWGQIRVDGRQQGAGLEEFAGVDAAGQLAAVGHAGCLGEADRHQLAGVVPFIGRGGKVHAVVALQADQAAAEPGGEHLGDLGLAGAGLAFEK